MSPEPNEILTKLDHVGLVPPDSGQAPAKPLGQGGQATCLGVTKLGKRCLSPGFGYDGYCAHHSPRYTAADRSSWGRRGALATIKKHVVAQLAAQSEEVRALVPTLSELVPSLATPSAIRDYLERMALKVEANTLAPSQAGAIAQLAALALRVCEVEIEARMLEEELGAVADADVVDAEVIK